MRIYRDMTFCAEARCGNLKCARNIKHVPDPVPHDMAVAQGFFKDSDRCPGFQQEAPRKRTVRGLQPAR